MAPDGLLVLRRVSAELFERCSRIKRYLDRIGPGDSGEYRQLAHTIRLAIDRIEQSVIDSFRTVQQLSLFSSGSGLNVVADALAKFSRWFTHIHELLVYLPREHVTPETFSVLEQSFGKIYDEQKPSILLGSLFNALEFDFVQLLKRRIPDLRDIILDKTDAVATAQSPRNVVLQIAICDRLSPLAWAILAHEMGHAIDQERELTDKVLNRFSKSSPDIVNTLRSWSVELCADLIAARVLGPAPMLALLSLEYCTLPQRPIYLPSHTHPATQWRLEVVSDYLRELHPGIDILGREKELYAAAFDYSLRSTVPDAHLREAELKRNQVFVDHVIRPLNQGLKLEIDKLTLPVVSLKQESLDRGIARLKKGLPIGAQGLPREQLRVAIEEYRASPQEDAQSRAKEFSKLASRFTEKPLQVAMILAGAFMRRGEMLETACAASLSNFSGERELCDDLARLDELVSSSIKSSGVHRNLVRGVTET